QEHGDEEEAPQRRERPDRPLLLGWLHLVHAMITDRRRYASGALRPLCAARPVLLLPDGGSDLELVDDVLGGVDGTGPTGRPDCHRRRGLAQPNHAAAVLDPARDDRP